MEERKQRDFDQRDVMLNERALAKLPRLVPQLYRSLKDECLSTAMLPPKQRYPDQMHRGPIVREMAIAGATAHAILCRLFNMGYRGADLEFPRPTELKKAIGPYLEWRETMLRDNQVDPTEIPVNV